MSPALTVSLTAAGVLLAGLPLLWLTAPPPAPVQQELPTTATQTTPVHVSLYFNGEPSKIVLAHQSENIAVFTAPKGPQHFTVQLPIENTIEIECEVLWPEQTAGMKGCTIHLEPEGRETRSETMWLLPEDNQLYDVFYFRW